MEISSTSDMASAGVTRNAIDSNEMTAHGRFTVDCFDAAGNAKWSESFDNLVTTQGKNHLLDNGLAGPASAVTTRMSFITSGTPVVGDTYATHAGFAEAASGVIATRASLAWSASAAGVKATNPTVTAVTIAGTGTIVGVAINAVVGTVGNLGVVADTATANAILYSAGTFTSKSVSATDTLNITYSTTLS